MNIEQNLDRIAAALEIIAASLSVVETVIEAPAPVPAPAPAPAPAAPAPVPVPAPAAPVPAPAAAVATPFPNNETLMQYAQRKYKELGAVKGASIQTVLESLGAKGVNQLSPDNYAAFFAQMEAIQ